MTRILTTIALFLLLGVANAFGAEPPPTVPPEGPDKSGVAIDPATKDADDPLHQRFRYLSIRDLTLEQAIDLIRDATHANLILETWRLEQAGFDPKRTVRLYLEDITFEHAFAALLTTYGRDVPIKLGQRNGNVLVISTPEGANGTTTQVYDIRLLIEYVQASRRGRPLGPTLVEADENTVMTQEEVVEQIVKLLQETIAPDSWRDNGGTDGAVREVASRLVITHTPSAHKQIEKFLKDLEQELSKPMPARMATQPAAKEAKP